MADQRNGAQRPVWNDAHIERLLSTLLRAGVVIAACVVAIGGAAYLSTDGLLRADHHLFRGEPPELRSITSIVSGALALRSLAIIQCGLLALIATPVLRVGGSLVAFALQRDRLYVSITAVVLGLLTFSIFIGLR